MAAQHRVSAALGKHLAQVVKETERKIGSGLSFARTRSFDHSPKSTALELDAGRDKPLSRTSG